MEVRKPYHISGHMNCGYIPLHRPLDLKVSKQLSTIEGIKLFKQMN
jgi:hypothetical protein